MTEPSADAGAGREGYDLDQPHGLVELLNATFWFYRQRFWVFVLTAFVVVLPLEFVLSGLVLGVLEDPDGVSSIWAEIGYQVVSLAIMQPLITAAHAYAVIDIANGERPTVGGTLRKAVGVLPAVGLAIVLAALVGYIGLALLILPGIYLFVQFTVVAPAAAVERLSPGDALGRSWSLVDGRWWWTLGVAFVLGTMGFLIAAVLGLPFYIGGLALDSGALTLAWTILLSTAAYSFTALAFTLLFFSLRAWHVEHPGGGASIGTVPRGTQVVVHWSQETMASNGEGIGRAWTAIGGGRYASRRDWPDPVPRSVAEKYAADNGFDFQPED